MTPPVDESTVRRAVGRFASGVCVVTAPGPPPAEGRPRLDHAMTATSFTSVSLDPPLVLVSVETDARFHDALVDAGAWAVNVLDETGRPVADWLAVRGRPVHGQLDRVPLRRGPRTGAALLDQATAWVECVTHALHPAGDHTLVVGEVVGAGVGGSTGALVRHRSAYRTID